MRYTFLYLGAFIAPNPYSQNPRSVAFVMRSDLKRHLKCWLLQASETIIAITLKVIETQRILLRWEIDTKCDTQKDSTLLLLQCRMG